MKTYKNLYPQICEFDNIHLAYLKARRAKRFKHEVLAFSKNLEENLINIQNHLIWKTYKPSPYKFFTIYEPKERLIAALPFTDRVVHHALCNIIEPIFERSMIYDSYACRVGQGVLSGVLRTTQFLYCLKADIKKFFPRCNIISAIWTILSSFTKTSVICATCWARSRNTWPTRSA